MTREDLRLALITAHQLQDWELARILSQAQERLKKPRFRKCACGVTICGEARQCGMCEKRARFYGGKIIQNTR